MSEEDADGGGRRRRNPVSRFFGYNTRRARHRAGPPPARGRAVAARGLGLGRARRGRRGGASDPVRARGRAARDEPRGTRRAGPTGTGLEARARRGLVTTPAGSRTASGGVRGRGASAGGRTVDGRSGQEAGGFVAGRHVAFAEEWRTCGHEVGSRAPASARARAGVSGQARGEAGVPKDPWIPEGGYNGKRRQKRQTVLRCGRAFFGASSPRTKKARANTSTPENHGRSTHKSACCCRLADWAARRARRASVPSETRVPGATPRLPRFDAAMRRSSRQPRGGNASTADALPPHGARRRARDPRTRRRRFLTLPL